MHKKFLIALVVGLMPAVNTLPAGAQEAAGAGQQAAPPSAAPQEAEEGTARRSTGRLPSDVAGLQQAAVEAYEAGNYLRFVQATILLRNQRPYEPQYLIGMVVGAALLGRTNTAYSYMHTMQQQGLSFDFNSTEDTESIRNTEVYDYINDLLVRAGDPLGKAEVAFTLPERASYPEAIVWDETRKRFLIGTVDTGAVLSVSMDGETEVLLEPGDDNPWWAVHGLAVDAERGRLWLTTTALPSFEGLDREVVGQSALLGFELDSLEPVGRYIVPSDGAPHLLGSIEVLPGGDVYAIDRAVPVLYRKVADGDTLDPYLGNRQLVGFRDLAASEDGQRLYLADAALGILVVIPGRQESAMLAVPETLNLGGLSGLEVSGNALLMVQNGIRPQRVLRVELDPTGMSVVDSKPIANALPEFDFPSFGTVHGDNIYYFAGGNLASANEGPVQPVVMKSPVEAESEVESIEQRKFQEETFGDN